MRTRRASPLDRARDLIAEGYGVTDVGSTDTHLTLVLGRDGTEHTLLLDKEETRRLIDEDVLAREQSPLTA